MQTANKIDITKIIGKGYNKFWHDKHFYRVVKGSRGSKKSRTTALNLVYRLIKYPWSNVLVVRRYSNTNHDSTYTALKWAINRLKVEPLFKFNESKPEITYQPTGQKILFRGLDDPLKVTSVDVDVGILSWAWFEEAYEIETADKFRTVVESIRGSYDSLNFFKQVTVTFNPWSANSWLKPMFFDEKTREQNVFATTTTYECNEWLDDEDKQRYADTIRTNPRRARITVFGEWGIAEGLVFDNVKVEQFDYAEKIKQSTGTGYGMDFGFTHDPSTFCGCAVDLKHKDIWIFDEMYRKAMLTEDILNWLRDHDYIESDISADCAEPRLIAECRNGGARRMHGSIKGRDSIDYGIQFLHGFTIHVLPTCKNAIEEFNTYAYTKDRDGNFTNKPEDKNNHFIDALRYAVEKYSMPQDKTPNRGQQTQILANLGII